MEKRVWLAAFLVAACGDDGGNGTREDAGVDMDAPDVTAPTVVSVTPIADATGVVQTTAVTVTFSEVMAPATLESAITLTPALPATVTWDEATLTATLTPTTPLHRAASYTLEVSVGATDVAGNALAAAHASTFTVEIAPPVRIDTGGAAIPESPRVVYDSAGNAVAVWVSRIHPYARDIYYATYTAANATWAPEVALATDADQPELALVGNGTTIMLLVEDGGVVARSFTYDSVGSAWTVSAPHTLTASSMSSFALVTNGTTFLAAWMSSSTTQAALWSASSWSTVTTLSTGTGQADAIRAASDGDAYAVGWLQRISGLATVHLAVHEAGTWKPTITAIEAGVTVSGKQLDLAGAADGSGFVAVWPQRPPSVSNDVIYAARWLRTAGNGTLQPLAKLSATTDSSINPSAVAGASGTWGVVWKSTAHVYFALWSGSAWSAPEQVTGSPELSSPPEILRVGPRYAVFWNDSGRVRNAGVWEDEHSFTSEDAVATEIVHTASGGFGVAHRELPATGAPRIVRTLYSGGAWGTPVVVSTAPTDARAVFIGERGGNFVTAWAEDADIAVRTGATSEALTSLPHPGHALPPEVRGSAGRSLVTWTQAVGYGFAQLASVYTQDAGWSAPATIAPVSQDNATARRWKTSARAGTFVFASSLGGARYHDGTAWGAAPVLTTYDLRVDGLAANDDVHMLVYADSDESDPTGRYFRTTSNGTWSAAAAMPFEDLDVELVDLTASAHGFIATWLSPTSELHASTFDGTSWTSPITVVPGVFDGLLQVTSNGTGYLLAWTSGGFTRARIFDGTSWGAVTDVAAAGDATFALAASNGSGYALAWRTTTNVYGATYAGSWASQDLGATASNNTDQLQLARAGAGYAISWRDNNDVLALARFDGATWAPTLTLMTSYSWLFGGGPAGVLLGGREMGASAHELRVHRPTASALGPATTLDAPYEFTGDAFPSWNGSSFSIVWSRFPVATETRINGIYGTGAF